MAYNAQYLFSHEQLDCYRLAVEVARWMRKAQFPRGDADLKDHGIRSSSSAALNIAEGKARGGKAEKNHYRIAHGSAAEACAVLDVVILEGGAEQQQKLRRVGAMLNRMAG